MDSAKEFMENNWQRFLKKKKKNKDEVEDDVPSPSAAARKNSDSSVDEKNNYEEPADSDNEDSSTNTSQLTWGQKIFRTKWTCPGTNRTNDFIFRTWLSEVVKYCFFLALLTICTFSYTNSDSFYLTSAMKSLYLDDTGFHKVHTESEIWEWLEGPFLKAVYQHPVEYNVMSTPPRIRMQRVNPRDCNMPDLVEDGELCYDEYHKSRENKDNLIVGSDLPQPARYTEIPGAIAGFDYWGQALPYLRMYWAGGYLLHLPAPTDNFEVPSKAIDDIRYLKNELDWLSRGARIVLIDCQLYNKNVNLYTIIRMSFELPASGGIITLGTAKFSTIHVYSNTSTLDITTVICEILWLILIGYYFGEKIYEMKILGFRGFFKHLALRTQFFNLIFSMAVVIFKMVKYAIINTEDITNCDPLTQNDCYLANFVFWQNQFNNFLAIVTFLSWIELNKFFTDFESTAVFTKTLRRCGTDLISFIIVFMMVFLAYAELGVLIFGGELDDFKNMFHSIYTLFRIILGDFDFHSMEQSNRILGPIYFIAYVFIVFFILINMFIAIISDTYSEVRAELSVPGEHRYPISEHVSKLKETFWGKLGWSSNSDDDDSEDDNQIDWYSFRKEMEKSGMEEDEIKAYFQKYDENGNLQLNRKEFAKLEESLTKLKNKDPDTVSQKSANAPSVAAGDVLAQARDTFVENENFDLLRNRVAKMESAFADLTLKVDGIIVKLDQLGQRQKQARIPAIENAAKPK